MSELDAEYASRLAAAGVANLCDGGASYLTAPLVPRQAGARIAGRATTAVTAPGDNLAAQVGVDAADVGDVLLISMPDEPVRACWGELMTEFALARGLAGLVSLAPIRDVAESTALGFPMWSTSVCPVGPTKSGPGSVHVDVHVGDAVIRDGDWLVADDDGVCVLTDDRLDAVVTSAEAKARREPAMITGLRGGASTMELLDIDASTVEVAARGERIPPPR